MTVPRVLVVDDGAPIVDLVRSYLERDRMEVISAADGPTALEVEDEGDFDLEGVAAQAEGGFWFASEGRTNVGSSRPNLLVRTDAGGEILFSVPLSDSLVAQGHEQRSRGRGGHRIARIGGGVGSLPARVEGRSGRLREARPAQPSNVPSGPAVRTTWPCPGVWRLAFHMRNTPCEGPDR